MIQTNTIGLKKPEKNEFIDVSVLNENFDKIDNELEKVENPQFDDSGTVPTIQSFTDFVNSIKSKMNIFEFYRNLKAGMQYVVHTGKLINNTNTTEEGFALDARVGKYLQDQIYANKEDVVSKKYIVNNVATSMSGTVLDGRIGKFLQEQINLLTKRVDFIEKNYWSLKSGTKLSAYTDLNTIKSIGNYFCEWNVDAETMENTPTAEAFILKVYGATGTDEYIGQELKIYHNAKVYTRLFLRYENRWTNWSEKI